MESGGVWGAQVDHKPLGETPGTKGSVDAIHDSPTIGQAAHWQGNEVAPGSPSTWIPGGIGGKLAERD
jgi:hypothetical protein